MALSTGCSDDADADNPSATTTTSTTTTTTATSGAGGGGSTSTADSSSATSGSGGGTVEPKPLEEITGPITSDRTLTSDKDYLLKGVVFVEAPATLTIEAGTKIMGEKASNGALVIEPGAKIHAEGSADHPIVFTSQAEPGERAPGDWGGLIVLGRAPINVPGGTANVEGITGDGTAYGGDKADDDSGVIKYVRIEFSGTQLSPDNEINGLTLAGVGNKTTIDYVMVHQTLDDCFEFFGGTVNAKHLICAYNGDDGFDWDLGYVGKLQFLALQQDPNVADDTNGFEGDNDADSSLNAPLSNPTIYNATLCGKNVDVDKQQYGMLLRRSTKAHLANLVVMGFEAGVDVRDAETEVELESSIFFGNLAQNVAYPEPGGEGVEKDDDAGFDEVAWFNSGSKNSEADPQIQGCFQPGAPDFRPAATLTDGAATPPNDGFFDASATFIGAFKSDDTWAQGAWVDFSLN
jgi:hypothetical protein